MGSMYQIKLTCKGGIKNYYIKIIYEIFSPPCFHTKDLDPWEREKMFLVIGVNVVV